MMGKYLNRRGKIVCSEKQYDAMKKFVSELVESYTTAGTDVASIVFSKDRAMQLHAFLRSYSENVAHRGLMYVLYKATDDGHRKSYEELKSIFIYSEFVFIEEYDFRRQLIELCEHVAAGKILFYVDDMMFTHKLDYDTVRNIDTSRYILALTRGSDLTYSTVLQKDLSVPKFYRKVEGFESFKWNESTEISDWTFPLGVSGYMFGRSEIVAMLKAVEFKAPNSLEAGMQLFIPIFINRFGLCTENAICTCVPANLVQSEWTNLNLGTFSIDELLSLWEAGKMIDCQEFYGKPVYVTQTQKYTFIDRL
jgi:hypothetical protein